MFLSSFFLLWFETSVHFWSCFYQSFRIIAQIRIWNLGSLPIEKLFSCQSLVNFGLTYITLEVTVIRNTSFACPRRGLYVLLLNHLSKYTDIFKACTLVWLVVHYLFSFCKTALNSWTDWTQNLLYLLLLNHTIDLA